MTEMQHIDTGYPGVISLCVMLDEAGELQDGTMLAASSDVRPIVRFSVARPGRLTPRCYNVAMPVEFDQRVYTHTTGLRWLRETPTLIEVDTTIQPEEGDVCCVQVRGPSGERLKFILPEHMKLSSRTVLLGVVKGTYWAADDWRKGREQ